MRRFLMSSALCATLSALGASEAQAQVASALAGDVIEEVVVTARKRAESLQDVPASIQVVGAEQVAALNVSSLTDLNGATPNATISNGGAITIRGITSNVRNAGFEAGAAVYVDGVYQGRPAGNDQDLVDIERVEILRGPQGTLYGKNTTAGAFNLTTVSPGGSWRGKGVVRLGEREEMQVAGYVAGPLVPDLLGGKFAFYRRSQEGYQRDIATGAKYGDADVHGTRGQLRFTPGDWLVDLRADYMDDRSVPAFSEPVSSPAVVPGRDTIASNIRQPRSVKGGGVSLTVEKDFGFGPVTSITAWRKLESIFTIDDDYYVVAPVFGNVSHRWVDESRQFSQEVRLVSNSSGPFSYVAGLYYFKQVLNADRPFDILGGERVFFDLVEIETDAYAGFINADYRLGERLTITGGLRYTVEEKRLDFEQKGFAPTGYPDIPRSFDKFTDRDLSPTLSARYEFTPDISGYVTVSRGFKAGGWNPDITTQTNTDAIQFEAEKITNYEAGLRTQLLDRRLTLNLTAYRMDYDDLQVSQFLGTNVGFVITNAGKAKVEGAEVELIAQPTSWLSLRGGGAYNDARYTQFLAGGGADYSGQRFTNAPKFSGYVAVDVDAPIRDNLSLILHGDYRYESSVFFDDARTVSVVGPYARDGYGLLNARIGVRTDTGLEVSIYGQNLTDERVLVTRTNDLLRLGIVLDTYGPPRQVGVRFAASF